MSSTFCEKNYFFFKTFLIWARIRRRRSIWDPIIFWKKIPDQDICVFFFQFQGSFVWWNFVVALIWLLSQMKGERRHKKVVKINEYQWHPRWSLMSPLLSLCWFGFADLKVVVWKLPAHCFGNHLHSILSSSLQSINFLHKSPKFPSEVFDTHVHISDQRDPGDRQRFLENLIISKLWFVVQMHV